MDSLIIWFSEEVWGLWIQGGSLMFMLLAIALILYYATLETYLFLKSRTSFKNTSKSTLVQWVGDPEKADHETKKMLHYVADGKETLGEARRRFDEIRACFLPTIDRRITFLSLLVSTAPLAGLLGTVMGMLTTFKGLSTSSGGKTIDFVAGDFGGPHHDPNGSDHCNPRLCYDQPHRVPTGSIGNFFHHPGKLNHPKLQGNFGNR